MNGMARKTSRQKTVEAGRVPCPATMPLDVKPFGPREPGQLWRGTVEHTVPRDPPGDQARETSVDGGKRERLPTVRGEAFFILI